MPLAAPVITATLPAISMCSPDEMLHCSMVTLFAGVVTQKIGRSSDSGPSVVRPTHPAISNLPGDAVSRARMAAIGAAN
jgi:hypothetical protein